MQTRMYAATSGVQMTAHNGLRGLLAVWVMVFHCVLYSDYPIDLQGSSFMPFFFLLSGFSLVVTYGGKTEEDGIFTDKKSFYRNRFARAFPVYYVCTFLAIPLWFAGYGGADPLGNLGAVIASIVVSVLPVCTFFIFLLGGPIDGPGWTICTLAVMWLFFPYSYPAIRARSDEQLTTDITNYYWLQLTLVLVIFPSLIVFTGFWPAFAASTMQPLVRYPLFLMGAFAGELCRRRQGQPLLWPNSGLGFFPACCCCKVEYDTALATAEGCASDAWSKRCWNACLLLVAVTLSITFVDATVRYQGGNVDASILGAWWYQAIVPFIQLEIIVALTRQTGDDQSSIQKIFLHPVSQWLGKLSMCTYLIHWVFIYYLCWLIEGKTLQWPEDYDCEDGPEHDECVEEIEDFQRARKIPVWGIFVVILTSLLAAEVLHRLVEVPGRRLLRAPIKPLAPEVASSTNGGVAFSPLSEPQEEMRVAGVPIFSY